MNCCTYLKTLLQFCFQIYLKSGIASWSNHVPWLPQLPHASSFYILTCRAVFLFDFILFYFIFFFVSKGHRKKSLKVFSTLHDPAKLISLSRSLSYSLSCAHARTHALALGERALINGTTNFLIRLLLWKLSGRAQHQLKCVKTIQGQKSFEKRGKDVITKKSNFYVRKRPHLLS